MAFLKQNPGHNRLMAISQEVQALDYLYGLDPLVHKDIKGGNVLFRDDQICVLSDFGLSKCLNHHKVSSAPKGSLNWMVPEAFDISLLKRQDNCPSDVYSLGCTIYESLTGSPPFAGQHPTAVMRKIIFNERCWAVDPEARPTILSLKKAFQYLKVSASTRPNLFRPKSHRQESEFEEFIPVLNWLRNEIYLCTRPSPWLHSMRLDSPTSTNLFYLKSYKPLVHSGSLLLYRVTLIRTSGVMIIDHDHQMRRKQMAYK